MDAMESLREEAIRSLSLAVAADRLTIPQFESRLALVRQAPNRATLDAILADVTPSGGFPSSSGRVPAVADHTAVVADYGLAPVEPAELIRIKSVMGSTKRAGSWTVPLRLELKVVLGEATIDLRDAVFSADVFDIDLNVHFGSVTLILPAGTQVENECEEKFSSSTHSTRSTRGGRRFGLLVRITGSVKWSSLEIKEKPPTDESPARTGWRRLLEGGD